MSLYLLRIVGAMSLVFVITLIVTQKWWLNRTERRCASSRFFWEIFCHALIVGLIFFIVIALLGSADDGEFIFSNFSQFFAYTGFCTLLITAGVAVFGRHYQEAKETDKQFIEREEEAARARNRAKEEASAKSEAQDKHHATAHFALAINYLTEGDTNSAFREYQIVEELDEVLASKLYDRIFSGEEN